MAHTIVVTTIPAQKETEMIELTDIDGKKFSLNPKYVIAVSIESQGTAIEFMGLAGRYYVRESYQDVLEIIEGRNIYRGVDTFPVLETK